MAVSLRAPRGIFVDVDDTLIVNGKANAALIAWLRQQQQDNVSLVLWSARGARYARAAAMETETLGLFDATLSKPGLIIDNDGIRWLKFARVVESTFGLKN